MVSAFVTNYAEADVSVSLQMDWLQITQNACYFSKIELIVL